MSLRPAAHVYLKDHFLYYDRNRVFLEGGVSMKLSRSDRAILECLERGESEIGVLARSLAELEVGGEPERLAEQLLLDHAAPDSLLAIGEPLDVDEPQVIVCSFSPRVPHLDVAPVIRRLRRRLRVAHIGLADHVSGDPRANLCYEAAAEAGLVRSPFQFVQWVRSFVRFHTRCALVLTGTQDLIFFGDLAATHHSLACVGPDWPPATGIQDILGSKGLLRDPLASLQSLFYALRMTSLADYERIEFANSSELAALGLYGVRNASQVAYSVADQPAELVRVGRPGDTDAPVCVAPSRRRKPAASGVLALVLNYEFFQDAAPVVGALHQALEAAGLREMVLRTEGGWVDVRVDGRGVQARPRSGAAPRPEVAILFPGLTRILHPLVDTLAEGIPTVCYPTQRPHTVLAGASDAWIADARTTGEWGALLAELLAPESARRAAVLAEAKQRVKQWDLAARVEQLVADAAAGD